MSALNPKDIEALHERLVRFFLDDMTEVDLVVPYGKEGVLAEIRKNIHVLRESYEEKGVCLTIKATPGTLAALKRRLAESTLLRSEPFTQLYQLELESGHQHPKNQSP